MARAMVDAASSEADWQRDVVDVAHSLGWMVYHTRFSVGSQSGYPDLTLCRERVVFIELKREGRPLTDAQQAWAERLRAAGTEVYAPCYPSDADALYAALAARRPA